MVFHKSNACRERRQLDQGLMQFNTVRIDYCWSDVLKKRSLAVRYRLLINLDKVSYDAPTKLLAPTYYL